MLISTVVTTVLCITTLYQVLLMGIMWSRKISFFSCDLHSRLRLDIRSKTLNSSGGGQVEIRMPFYYSDDMVFQMGPAPHLVWGYVSSPLGLIEVEEACFNGHSKWYYFKVKKEKQTIVRQWVWLDQVQAASWIL